jgi:hypothetical protein
MVPTFILSRSQVGTELEPIRVQEADGVTHLRYRVCR